MGWGNEDMPTTGYARVSNREQKNDLVRQQEMLEAFCAAKGSDRRCLPGVAAGRVKRAR